MLCCCGMLVHLGWWQAAWREHEQQGVGLCEEWQWLCLTPHPQLALDKLRKDEAFVGAAAEMLGVSVPASNKWAPGGARTGWRPEQHQQLLGWRAPSWGDGAAVDIRGLAGWQVLRIERQAAGQPPHDQSGGCWAVCMSDNIGTEKKTCHVKVWSVHGKPFWLPSHIASVNWRMAALVA
jgi:hypothetical protein